MSNESNVSRRDLLGRSSALALGLLVGGAGPVFAEELEAVAPLPQDKKPAVPVVCAVIGLGDQGREILRSLAYLDGAQVKYVCDSYVAIHKRALELAPKATATADYKQVLGDAAVQAVWIATPTHLHKQIALDALAAGKSVYCEVPLAHTVEDARAIAQAAKAAGKQVFHAGLQERTNPQHHHVLKFVSTGALGTNFVQARAQWNRKDAWRRTAPSDTRQRELNWRLDRSVSSGLVGEIGIHSIDTAVHFLKSQPVSVMGFGSVTLWRDGRDVADTVNAVVEFANGVRLVVDLTLANSFSGNYELFQGSDAAVLLKDPIEKNTRAWMFKEADATALGWEVYAYREKVGDDTGIALVADASKLLALGLEPGKNRQVDPKKTPLFYACEAFLEGVRNGKPTESGPEVGYRATVLALKANEAIVKGTKLELPKELLEI